jgi:hypothetical protein
MLGSYKGSRVQPHCRSLSLSPAFSHHTIFSLLLLLFSLLDMTLYKSAHFVRNIPSEEADYILRYPDSFSLLHYPIHTNAETARDLLAYGGIQWKDEIIEVHNVYIKTSFLADASVYTSPSN